MHDFVKYKNFLKCAIKHSRFCWLIYFLESEQPNFIVASRKSLILFYNYKIYNHSESIQVIFE